MLQQCVIKYGVFDQCEGVDCRVVIEGGVYYWQVFMKCFKCLGVNVVFDGWKKDFFSFYYFVGDDDFLWVEQVNGDGDCFFEVVFYVFNYFVGQGIVFVGCFVDSFDCVVIWCQMVLVVLFQQVVNLLFNGGIGCDGFQIVEVVVVVVFVQWVDLNMVNFVNVVVVVDKNVFVGDNFCFGIVVYVYQNGVFVILVCVKIVFGQCQVVDIVVNKVGNVEVFFQCFDQVLVFYCNMWYIVDYVVFWVDEVWQDY